MLPPHLGFAQICVLRIFFKVMLMINPDPQPSVEETGRGGHLLMNLLPRTKLISFLYTHAPSPPKETVKSPTPILELLFPSFQKPPPNVTELLYFSLHVYVRICFCCCSSWHQAMRKDQNLNEGRKGRILPLK